MDEIGFVGLGTMGAPMARRLVRAGHRLRVFDLDADASSALAEEAGVVADASARAVAARCATVFACLPDPAAGREALLGPKGIAAGANAGHIVCDHSTVDPTSASSFAAAFAGQGVSYVECPVLGGRAEAESGTLFAIASGDETAYRRVEPFIALVSRGRRFVGSTGTASRFKSIQNGLGLVQWAGMMEALGILARTGADLDAWYEVVVEGHGMADTPLFRTMAKKVISGDPALGAFLRIGAKDVGLADQQAQELGLDAPVFAAANALFREAIELGLGESDIAEVARVIERRFDVRIRS